MQADGEVMNHKFEMKRVKSGWGQPFGKQVCKLSQVGDKLREYLCMLPFPNEMVIHLNMLDACMKHWITY